MRKKAKISVLCIVFGLVIMPNISILNFKQTSSNQQNLYLSDDTYEDNNHIDDSTKLTIGTYIDLECYDNDYYGITVDAGFKILVEIEFTNDTGNLELELFDRDKLLVNSSYLTNDYEVVSYKPLISQDIYFRVFYVDNPNLYNLTISIIAGTSQEVIKVFKPDEYSVWNVSTTNEIVWTASSQITDVIIELYRGAFVDRTIISSTTNDGSYSWSIPTDIVSSDDYLILIKDLDSNPQSSSNYFTIHNPSLPRNYINLQTPNSSTVWQNGTLYEIKWESSLDFSYVEIILSGPSGQYITEGTDNDGSYLWNVPDTIISGQYNVYIKNNESAHPYHSGESFRILNTEDPVKNIAISNPISTTRWLTSNSYQIRWSSSGDIENVTIYYDSPLTTRQTIAINIVNDGEFIWNIPISLDSHKEYTIRIEETIDSNNYDESQNFIIDNPNDPKIFIQNPVAFSKLEVDQSYNITWVSLGNIENVTLTLSNQFGEVFEIASEITNIDYYEWNIPTYLIGNKDYVIRVSDSSNLNIFDDSEEFDILNTMEPVNTITLINPGPYDQFYTGNSYALTWKSTGSFENVTLHLYNKIEGFVLTITDETENDGSLMWNVPGSLNSRTDYYLAIYNSANCTPHDTSDYFEIINDHSITVLNPTGSSVWEKQRTYEIQWTSTGTFSHVRILYEYWGGNTVEIISSTENDGSYLWTLPPSLVVSDDYYILIQELGYPNIEDRSEMFEVIDLLAPSITVFNPNSSSSWQIGQTYEINWDSTGLISNVDIILTDNTTNINIVIATSNDGSYLWNIPSSVPTFNDYHIIIRDSSATNINDTSDGFSIVQSGDGTPFPPEFIITIVGITSAVAIGVILAVVLVRKRKLKP